MSNRLMKWLGMAAATLLFPGVVAAQAYPAKSVRLITPFTAGSAIDVLARLHAQKLSDAWRQQVVVDNRAGANGIIGTEMGARAPADGHTLTLGNVATLAANVHLYKKLPYDPLKDFTPLSLSVVIQLVLTVHPSLPAHSVKELVALAKRRAGELNYASGGIGSAQHLPMEMLKSMAGINIVHVVYKGLTPAFNDVVSGQTPMIFSAISNAVTMGKAGKLRMLAVGGAKRSPSLPDVPTVAEAGVPGYEFASWSGYLAPVGTPPDIVSRLEADLARVTKLPDVAERLTALGFDVAGTNGAEFGVMLRNDINRLNKVIREAGIRAE